MAEDGKVAIGKRFEVGTYGFGFSRYVDLGHMSTRNDWIIFNSSALEDR